MKVSLKWLNDYIRLEDVPSEEVAEKLSRSGLEVDEIIDKRKLYENFVVGYVKEKEKHPNADKLSLCKVSDGTDVYDVICGAPNVEAGQKIAFAKIGAVMPNSDFKIAKAKIRGEYSYGMICSESELGISEDHEGIMVLNENAKEGKPLAVELGLDDVAFDIDLTPNRADALSHLGVARDLAALYNREVNYPKIDLNENSEKSEELAKVEIDDVEGCPRYVAKIVQNVSVKESPEWLKAKLVSIGLRPINNIVDVTNFVLHEIGQPLHAFDLEKLEGKKIIVRKAGKDKKITTLDSKERELKPDDLMICDAEKPIAVAGVMGGENSEVTEKTKNILIESAYFNPSRIRKTAKRLGISSDASYRFERGVDPNNALTAANRAAQLIAELSGGEIAEGAIDDYPEKIHPKKVEVRFSRIDKVLGYKILPEEVERILTKLGFEINENDSEKLSVLVPTFRHDVEREIDLIEEIARIYGYDRIPDIPRITVSLDAKVDQLDYKNKIRGVLTSMGFYEIITNTLLKKESSENFGNPIPVLNPQTNEMTHMRTSLIPGMLSTIAKNLKVREKNLQLFEIGHIFKQTNNEIDSFEDFSEEERLLIAITGNETISAWYEGDKQYDFFNLKGYIESLFEKIQLSNFEEKYSYEEDNVFEYSYQISSDIGKGGKVDSDLLKKFDIDQDIFLFDLNLELLKKAGSGLREFEDLLKYPKIIKDFAFVLDKEIESGEVKRVIRKGSSKLLKNIRLFDIFENDSLGKNKKSLAFQVEYFDAERTLTEEEVEKDFWKTIERVKTELNAELRGA